MRFAMPAPGYIFRAVSERWTRAALGRKKQVLYNILIFQFLIYEEMDTIMV